MVAVVVRDDQIVDPFEARLLHGGGNAIGIAAVEPGVAGVHQQRFTRRRDEQGRLAAFDVDELDVERLLGLGHGHPGGPGRGEGEEGKQGQERAHGAQV